MLAGPAPIERVEKTNAVIVHPNLRGEFAQRNPYAIDINKNNRNCYNCKRFGHLARNCRNRRIENRIGEGRLEYRQRENKQNLNRK